MYLTDYIFGARVDKSVKVVDYDATTYPFYYRYWLDELFNKTMRLFKWECDPVPPKEIESRLLMAGHCAIAKFKGELTAFWNSFYGVTKYQDEWTNINIRCPIWAGSATVGKNAIVIDNNELRNPLMYLISHYAQLLAHAEVTIINALVNVRDSGGVPTVSTSKQKQSMKTYYQALYKGKHDTVTDIANLGVQYLGADRKTQQSIKDLFEVRSGLIKSFYGEIGIRASFEKGNNAVVAEVTSDSTMLTYNLTDMLETRKKGVEKINELFGVNWSVELIDILDYEAQEKQMMQQALQTGGMNNAQSGDGGNSVQGKQD